jgi:hypothetical protein
MSISESGKYVLRGSDPYLKTKTSSTSPIRIINIDKCT